MSTTARRGWSPPRRSVVSWAVVCLAAFAALFAAAPVCLAAGDVPLRALSPLPVFSTEPGPYRVAISGPWTLSPGPTATIELELGGRPIGSWLYIAGRDQDLPGGDPDITVSITDGTGRKRFPITRVPVVYATETHMVRYVNRVEITKYLTEGKNKIAISGWDYDIAEGAFAYAVYNGGAGTPEKYIQVREGADIAYFGAASPLGPDSEVVSFRFDASVVERPAWITLAISDGEASRGDEVFGLTGTGVPRDQLRDTDGDGRLDIVNRGVPLTLADYQPRGIDPANEAGNFEANRRAFSLEEDCLGASCSIGPEFNIVRRSYTIPAGHAHANFQVQSEDPENGDSLLLIFALNEVPTDGTNPVPDIQVVKNVTPTLMPEPGGPAEFEVIVTNPPWSEESLRLTSLVDSVFGNLAGRGTCLVPRTIARNSSYRCTFTALVNGTVESPHRDVVIASGTGSISGAPVSASDDAVVTFTRAGLGSIGDLVWLDANRNGVLDGGETGINGVTVTLRDAGGNILATTTTATSGSTAGFYVFPNLAAGTYTVEVLPPAGLAQTYDLDGLATPNAATRGLGADEDATDVDFGYAQLAPDFTVTKSASIDEGYPGDLVTYTFVVTNTGQIRLENVVVTDDKLGYIGTVTLELGESKTLTKTDYALPVCGSAGLTVATLCDGATVIEGYCSLPNTVTAAWGALSRKASDCINILPFGTIGDFVWEDLDRDGLQDAGEPGLPGVAVTLSLGGVTKGTAVTDGAGAYLFTGLRAGSYVVDPGGKAGYGLTTNNDPLPVALGIGQVYLHADFGYAQLVPDFTVTKSASIAEGYPGDPVTYTFVVTNTGQIRLENVVVTDDKLGYIGTVTLELGESKTLTKTDYALPVCGSAGLTVATLCDGATVIEGYCSLPNTVTAAWGTLSRKASDCINILPFGTIGDFVWEDLDRDGLQDAGEPGLSGVAVTLSLGGVTKGTAVTDGAGAYLFTGLRAGSYVVDPGGKAGYGLTTNNDPLPVALGIGQVYLNADFGYWQPSPGIAVTKAADPTFGYLFRADPTTPWPYALIPTTLDVAYTVEVTNPGDEPLAGVTVTDDPATLVFDYESGDVNGDGKLDLTEKWIFTASWSYDRPGVYPDTVTARGTGAISGKVVTATADASVEAVGCGQCLGKVSVLSLRYNGAVAAMITVEVENSNFTDPVAFSGTVQPGGVFTFGPLSSPNGGFDGTLGTNISVLVNGSFSATIHTSCSQPIYPGQDWGPNGATVSGPFTVVSGSSKQGGLLCPIVEK